MPRRKKNDLNLPPGVSHEWRASGSLRLKWRNRIQRRDGSIGGEQRSATVQSITEARDLATVISRALRERGYYCAGDGPYRSADEDLEDVFLAYLEHKRDFDLRATNTISNIAHAFGRFTRGLRHLLELDDDDMLPARSLTLDSYQRCIRWANTQGNRGKPYGQGTVYQTAFIVLDAWTWAADQRWEGTSKWPTLPAPPYNVSSNLPSKPDYAPPTDIATWAELDSVVNRIYSDLPEHRAANAYRAFWFSIIERYTGIRQFQAAGIHREDIDEDGLTVLVRRGKSGREKALNRRMAASPFLFRDLEPLLGDARLTGPLFPDASTPDTPVVGYRNATRFVSQGWNRAIGEKKARHTVLHPPGRAKAAPNHAFRSAVQQHLEDQGVSAKVIDWLVGHAPVGTRARHYTRASMTSQQEGVAHIPEIAWENMPFPRRFNLYVPPPPRAVQEALKWASLWAPAAALS